MEMILLGVRAPEIVEEGLVKREEEIEVNLVGSLATGETVEHLVVMQRPRANLAQPDSRT